MKMNLIKLAKIASIAILPLAAVGCLSGGGNVTSSDGNGGPGGGSVILGDPGSMGPSTGEFPRHPRRWFRPPRQTDGRWVRALEFRRGGSEPDGPDG